MIGKNVLWFKDLFFCILKKKNNQKKTVVYQSSSTKHVTVRMERRGDFRKSNTSAKKLHIVEHLKAHLSFLCMRKRKRPFQMMSPLLFTHFDESFMLTLLFTNTSTRGRSSESKVSNNKHDDKKFSLLISGPYKVKF